MKLGDRIAEGGAIAVVVLLGVGYLILKADLLHLLAPGIFGSGRRRV